MSTSLKTEGSQTPDVTTDGALMETESDAVIVATTPDNPKTQPVEVPLTNTTQPERTIQDPKRFKDYIKYKRQNKLLKHLY